MFLKQKLNLSLCFFVRTLYTRLRSERNIYQNAQIFKRVFPLKQKGVSRAYSWLHSNSHKLGLISTKKELQVRQDVWNNNKSTLLVIGFSKGGCKRVNDLDIGIEMKVETCEPVKTFIEIVNKTGPGMEPCGAPSIKDTTSQRWPSHSDTLRPISASSHITFTFISHIQLQTLLVFLLSLL